MKDIRSYSYLVSLLFFIFNYNIWFESFIVYIQKLDKQNLNYSTYI